MKRTRSTTKALSAAVLALTLVATACSPGDNEPSASPSASASASPSPSASQSASPETMSATGSYTGLVDSHSVEIKTDEGDTVFQISSAIAEQVSDWDAGTKVKFEYTEETFDVDGNPVKQRTLTSIEKE